MDVGSKLKSTNTTVIQKNSQNIASRDVDGHRKEGMDKCQVTNIIYDT